MKDKAKQAVSHFTKIAAIAFGLAAITAGSAAAQYASMSCGELWYARNAIFAANGHCFNTARGIASFGRGCFPPYGRLSGGEQRRVNAIQNAEYRKGC